MKIFSARSSRSLRKARLARLAREHQGGGGQLNFAGRFFPAAPAAPPELVESPVRLVGVRRCIPRVMFQECAKSGKALGPRL